MKVKKYVKENRFVVALLFGCSIVAVIFFCLGCDPDVSLIDSLRNLFSSLTAEIIGAMIGIFFIDYLLRRHREQDLQGMRGRFRRKVFTLGYETITLTVLRISQPEYDPIDGKASSELFYSVHNQDFDLAQSKIDDVFVDPFVPVHPIIYGRVASVCADLLTRWDYLLDRFDNFLTAKELSDTVDVISQLEKMVSQYRSMEEVMDDIGLDEIIWRKDKSELDKLANSKAAQELGANTKDLCCKVLNVLKSVRNNS